MRSIVFARRTLKELLRDPISYVFCLAFPLVMLGLMSVINESIPREAGMVIFQLPFLAPGIAVFGLSFVMMFACLQVTKDRAGALMTRLYASPMTAFDFLAGYSMAFLTVAGVQSLVCLTVSAALGMFIESPLTLGGIVLCLLSLVPTALLFLGFGLLSGALLSDKAAPGVCSVIISLAGMLGGIWMDAEALGGVLARVCRGLPFYWSVRAARMAMAGEVPEMFASLWPVLLWGGAVYGVAVWVLARRIKRG